MQPPKVLFIEEDLASVRFYIKEMQDEKLEVVHIRKADEVLNKLDSAGATVSLIILDSAMPPGKSYESKATESGTQTGQFLFADIRERLPTVPIIILSNFSGLEWIQKASEKPKVKSLNKLATLPSDLIKHIRMMLK